MDIQSMERWNSLSTSEMRVLRELLQRVERGDERIPIRSVAKSAYVSTTSIVRLAQKLGFGGFSELLYSLKHEYQLSLPSGMHSVRDRIITDDASYAELGSVAEALSMDTFERVDCMGCGYSDLVAHYLCNRLLECGIFATTKSPLDFRDDRKTLTVFISESGETKDLLFIQERIRSRDSRDLVFTADAASSLGQHTNHCVLVKRDGYYGDNESNFFAINCMTLVESLMVAFRSRKREEEMS